MVAHAALACALAIPALGQNAGPASVTLDQAVQMALQHNHNLLAARATIQQSQAEEITANLRPDPTLIGDAEYLSPTHPNTDYLSNSSEFDLGLSYLFERGKKRQHRLQAARDITAQTRSLVADNERSLSFNVASLFVNVQLAESTLELADLDLKSFGKTVEIGELSYKAGAISEDDYLKIKLQLLQFETDYQQAQLAKIQALSDLRQLLGYESVPPDYDVVGPFDYQPVKGNVEDLQLKAMQNRPDLRAARGHNRGEEPVRSAKGDRKARLHGAGELYALWRHQHGIALWKHSASDFRPQPGRDSSRELRHHAGPGTGKGDQRPGPHRCA
jgi:outer membrane protein, heavy metal efflux system